MSKQDNQVHFSVEDMVEAAQDKVSQDRNPERKKETREVVVQEDGTKVVKVRRRKRKTTHKDELLSTAEDEKKGYLKLLLVTVAALLILSLILAGIFFFKIAYFNSPDFATNVEGALNSKLHSKVDVQGFRVGPTSSIVKRVKIESNTNELPFFNAELTKLSFKHKPETVVLGGLSGSESVAEGGTLLIDYDKTAEVKKGGEEDASFNIPLKHKSLDIKSANIALNSEKNAPRLVDSKARLIIRPDNKIQLFLKSGQLENLENLPGNLEAAIIVNESESLSIKTLKLSSGTVGNIEIKGDFSKLTRLPQTLEANFNNFRLETLNENLSEIMEARVNSVKGTIEISPESKEYLLLADLQTANVGFALKNLKFLESVGEKLGTMNYSYVRFIDATRASMQISQEGYTFKEINFEKKGSLALEGQFQVSNDGALSGNLKVGVPTAKLLREYPDVNRQILETNKGYTWFDVTLSGDVRKPQDNFNEQFDAVVDALN